jgi:hypothetical protein
MCQNKHVRFQILIEMNMKMAVFWVVGLCTRQKFTDVSEVLAASTIRVMITTPLKGW